MGDKRKAVVLLSGGMDSTTVAASIRKDYDEVYGVAINYGQKHSIELERAEWIAGYLGLAGYHILDIAGTFQNSSLLSGGDEIIDGDQKAEIGSTYVPARNAVFLSMAAGYADSIDAEAVYYGAHGSDEDNYPDCTPEFLQAISHALSLGTVNNVEIRAPFIHMTKADIVTEAAIYAAPLGRTISCYRGTIPQCGTCPTCVGRIEAFRVAGFVDPVDYLEDPKFPQSAQIFPGGIIYED